jgi:hypothetical protein
MYLINAVLNVPSPNRKPTGLGRVFYLNLMVIKYHQTESTILAATLTLAFCSHGIFSRELIKNNEAIIIYTQPLRNNF